MGINFVTASLLVLIVWLCWLFGAWSADGDDNLMHKLIDCANAYCTVGEMVTTLKSVWGEFQQPVVF